MNLIDVVNGTCQLTLNSNDLIAIFMFSTLAITLALYRFAKG